MLTKFWVFASRFLGLASSRLGIYARQDVSKCGTRGGKKPPNKTSDLYRQTSRTRGLRAGTHVRSSSKPLKDQERQFWALARSGVWKNMGIKPNSFVLMYSRLERVL